jgi:hypothetical protein
MSWLWSDRKFFDGKRSSYSVLPAPSISPLILPRFSSNSIDGSSSLKTKIRSVQKQIADLVSQTNSSSPFSRSSVTSSWSPNEPFTNLRNAFEFPQTQLDSFSGQLSLRSLPAGEIESDLRKEASQPAAISATSRLRYPEDSWGSLMIQSTNIEVRPSHRQCRSTKFTVSPSIFRVSPSHRM